MMIRTQSGYLDFNGEIEIERKIKVFDDISTSDGDVSFGFELQRTSNNMSLLGLSIPDSSSKRAYERIYCDILTEDGISVYSGYLAIEQLNRDTISVAFYSGNSNWFGLLSGKLQDIDWSQYDQELNASNIVLSHSATEGLVFPILDNSELQRRGYRHMKVEDFVAGIYIKTVFKAIFQFHSIKITGDLLEDPVYNSALILKNSKSQDDLDAASFLASKTTTTARPIENTDYKVTFDTISVYPALSGSLNIMNIATSTVTMPFKMTFDIEIILKPSIVDASYSNRIWLYINGVYTFQDIGLASGTGGLTNSANNGADELFTLKRRLTLDAGDTLEVYSSWQQSGGSTQNDVLSGTMEIKPVFIYSVFGGAILPDWSQADYVSNIMRLLNVVTSYDNKTSILTLNLFDKIKSKPQVDLSAYVEDNKTTVDYKEFISSYGKRSLFSYNDVNFEDLRKYNVQNVFKYGTGLIEVDNDFIADEADVIELDFSNPIDYLNPIFGMSMTKTNILTLNTDQQYDIATVTDNGGQARFNLPENNILVGDLVRISESDNPNYNGDWYVTGKATGYLDLYGIPFDTDATAKIAKLNYDYNDSDSVFLVWNIPFYNISDMSQFPDYRLETLNRTTFAAYGYFSLLNTGSQANVDFKQSLSFGDINDLAFYQFTILDIYWPTFRRILNDPVKLICEMYLPQVIFDSLDLMHPVALKSETSSNMYYINKISGYKNSAVPCVVELIKLP